MTALMATLFLFVFILIFGAALVWVSGLFGPMVPRNSVQLAPYECGIPEQSSGHTKIPVKFYLTAILFILFDIEIIFMYPWALSFLDSVNDGSGIYMLSVMGIFLAVFIYGLVWEIKSKALEWE